ncbi:NAD-dependent epimerase/dehydratase family protein [Sphingomonas gei]|uniref:NAD-dependent epimerase/dehydratase family protein n=1 Tax=Sphingomonas gei TaxID=1395960 RepID=A0A4S1X8S7_9SPHN|nr:NAD-dependent epimerase/dehydratase family protein [Sphingomonas gei]TGX52604.1 NAD-dependent epimerase/dehydratase family protein [Sphingomonas gei]
MTKTALILGATGGVGGETARALVRHGWGVRGLARMLRPHLDPDIAWFEGDALDAAAVLRAAEGVSAIVHAVNPPGYRGWPDKVPAMLANSIAAARANGARLALPGTIYNYDPAATPVAEPDSPQQPRTRKGGIRVEMEQSLETAGVPALILRAGDFYGPRPGNSWLTQGMVKPQARSIVYPGAKGAGHGWAYLPDVGETFARLLDRERELPHFARYHFGGHWDADGTRFVAAIREALGKQLPVGSLPWWALPLIAPFNPTMRELIEMRPYWQHPVRLDNRELVELLGSEPHTPLVESLVASFAALGIGA